MNRLVFSSLMLVAVSTATAQTQRAVTEPTENPPRNQLGEPVVGKVIAATSLLGRDVRTDDGQKAGKVLDLALDLDEGQVAAVMISADEVHSADATKIPVPWALVASVSSDTLHLKAPMSALEQSPRLKPGQALQNATRLWLATVFQHYKLAPYWDSRQQASAWGKSSDYGKLFNPDRMVSVEGRVSDVSYLSPLAGMAVGTQLTLATEEGVVKVQLGPLSHLSQQGVSFEKDARVQVKGSRIMLAGHPVVMATELQMGEQRLALRNADGTVLWREWTEQDSGYVPASLKMLVNTPVRNDAGENLGKLSDFAIASDTGLLAYAAMTCSCFENAGDRLYPVPLSSFVVQPQAEAWMLQLPLEVLENMKPFPSQKWPEKIDRGWVEYVHVRYGRSPFGGVRTKPHPEPKQ